MADFFQSLIFREPSSLYVTAISGVTLLFVGYLGISELMGKHLNYSKFWNVQNSPSTYVKKVKISSRTGMLLLYSPAAIAGLSSFLISPNGGVRYLMVKAAVSIHFSKRVFETLFVHKYSGAMMLDSAILISSSYLFAASGMIYIQSMTVGFAEPSIDLKYLGLLVFIIGTSGNFYHHYLLANLRSKNETGYKIPTGGLFGFVICPHYLFEIIALFGISLMAQTLFAFSVSIGSAIYLAGRSHVTRKWYLSKFEDFPKNVKALIPFVF